MSQIIDVQALARQCNIDTMESESERSSKWPAMREDMELLVSQVLERAAVALQGVDEEQARILRAMKPVPTQAIAPLAPATLDPLIENDSLTYQEREILDTTVRAWELWCKLPGVVERDQEEFARGLLLAQSQISMRVTRRVSPCTTQP